MNTSYAVRVCTAQLRLLMVAIVTAVLSSGFTRVVESAEVPELDATAGARRSRVEAPATRSGGANGDGLSLFNADAWSSAAVGRINPKVLRLALRATRCATARGALRPPATLTIIDYSKASIEPRLWVLDLRAGELLYEELVSHGEGSGGNFATDFSNTPDSHQTSLGLFVTDTTYVGRNGYSLRLDGLERGVNDRARERAIVIHGAPYVNASTAKSLGRLGRSHGCPAVREAVARDLIDRIKGGSLVFAYYPDAEWLRQSRFLNSCGD